MAIPFVIDNDRYRLSDVLNALLAESSGKPLDVAGLEERLARMF